MTAQSSEIPYRRIGTILAEWRLITDRQLAQALAEQEETGRLLGEVLVSGYGVSRVDLADALAEQWQEANKAASAALEQSAAPTEREGGETVHAGDVSLSEADLRVLLDEAEAARAELAVRTEELSRRLATLETLVVGVTEALEELRSANAQDDGRHRAAGAQRAGTRRARGRASTRANDSHRPAAP